MTTVFLQKVAEAVRCGLSVSAIERLYGWDNRSIRRAKNELYRTGALTPPTGYKPKDAHDFHKG